MAKRERFDLNEEAASLNAMEASRRPRRVKPDLNAEAALLNQMDQAEDKFQWELEQDWLAECAYRAECYQEDPEHYINMQWGW